jgi:hypothetical protein
MTASNSILTKLHRAKVATKAMNRRDEQRHHGASPGSPQQKSPGAGLLIRNDRGVPVAPRFWPVHDYCRADGAP